MLNLEIPFILVLLDYNLNVLFSGEKPKYKYNNTGPVLGVVGGSYSSVSLQVIMIMMMVMMMKMM